MVEAFLDLYEAASSKKLMSEYVPWPWIFNRI